jgi:hypothetical protein
MGVLVLVSPRNRQRHELDAAISLAGRLHDALRDQGETPPHRFMLGVQIRSLLQLLDVNLQHELRQEGSPFAAAFAPSPEWEDPARLADALKALKDLLEVRRASLQQAAVQDQDAPAEPRENRNNGDDDNDGSDPDGTEPVAPTEPDASPALWHVAEKLYESWPVRGLLVLVGLAIVFAMGGSYIIAGQTLNMRQSLDNALEKAQNEITNISETTRTRLAAESQETLAGLHERRQDIDLQMRQAEKEVADLKGNGDKIKTDIVTKLQEDLGAKYSGMRDQILQPVADMRDKDLPKIVEASNKLSKTIEVTSSEAERQKDRLTSLGPKLTQLEDHAKQSDRIAGLLSTINTDLEAAHNGRTNAEASATAAASQKAAAEAAAGAAEGQNKRAAEAVKKANDETIDNNRALERIEVQLSRINDRLKGVDEKLKGFDDKLKEFDDRLTSADGRQKASDRRLYALDSEIALQEEHLKGIKKQLDVIGKDLPAPPPKDVPTPPALKPVAQVLVDPSDLSPNQLKRIQRGLVAQGFSIDVDGTFGGKTADAIKAYQAKVKAEATGQLTPEQLSALRAIKAR